jgi:tRNA 2-thiouridine synthesizing protein A
MSETILDTRGLNCPLPVLRLRKAMRQLPPGALVRVLASDPGTVRDFQALCQTTGDQLLESQAEDDEYRFLIRKSA